MSARNFRAIRTDRYSALYMAHVHSVKLLDSVKSGYFFFPMYYDFMSSDRCECD